MHEPNNSSHQANARGAHPTDVGAYRWSVRARKARPDESGAAIVYARTATITTGDQSSFRESDEIPTVVEHFLGLVAADLIAGLRAAAPRHGVQLDEIEATVTGSLDNALVHLGVIGEVGHAGFGTITATVYVSSDAEPDVLEALWLEVRRRSPVVNTLGRAVSLVLDFRVTY